MNAVDAWHAEFLASRPKDGSVYRTVQGTRYWVRVREDGMWLESEYRTVRPRRLLTETGPIGRYLPELATPAGMEPVVRAQLARLAAAVADADEETRTRIASLARRIAPMLATRSTREVLTHLRCLHLAADEARQTGLTTLIPTNPSQPARKAAHRADVTARQEVAA